MDGVTINIRGLAEMKAALEELPLNVERKHLRSAVSDGAAVVRDQMRAMAPVYPGRVSADDPPPGTLRASVYMVQVPELSQPWTQTFFVGCRHGASRRRVGKKQRNLDAYYFFMVEFGTSKMSARPFMRPAFDSRKSDALVAIVSSLRDGVDQAAADVAWGQP